MARIARNISAVLFLITASLTQVRLQAQGTCYQHGLFVVGQYCEMTDMCSFQCREYWCFQYAGSIGAGEDCHYLCLDGAEQWCNP